MKHLDQTYRFEPRHGQNPLIPKPRACERYTSQRGIKFSGSLHMRDVVLTEDAGDEKD